MGPLCLSNHLGGTFWNHNNRWESFGLWLHLNTSYFRGPEPGTPDRASDARRPPSAQNEEEEWASSALLRALRRVREHVQGGDVRKGNWKRTRGASLGAGTGPSRPATRAVPR